MASASSIQAEQVRGHAGHSHDHHHDTTYLTSTNKADPGVRITRIGLYTNVGMAVSKGIGGYIFNSQALTADALHSLTDLIADFMTLATISYSIRPPSKRFPTGYGKVESLGALAVSGVLLSGGIMIGLQAIVALTQQFFPDVATFLANIGLLNHVHDHGIGAEDFGPNINAAWLAAGSILAKEWLYRATMKVAIEKRSSVLASNAYHHRVDSLTAIVALLSITASHFLNNAQWLDPVGGLIISGMILQAGVGNTKSALLELADVSLEDDIKESIETAVTTVLAETKGKISAVQGIKGGQNYLVEIAIAVPESSTLKEQKEIESLVREHVASSVKGAKRVAVRFVSTAEANEGFTQEFLSFDATHDHHAQHDHSAGHEEGVQHDSPLKDSTKGSTSGRDNGSARQR